MSDWDNRFLDLAEHVAQWSKDPARRCGAVIVRPDRTIASLGYNGFPRGTLDLPHYYTNKQRKRFRVVHAEVNAILTAQEHLRGYTMYCETPCAQCAAAIIQAGIARVVVRGREFSPHWHLSIREARMMLAEADVAYDVL